MLGWDEARPPAEPVPAVCEAERRHPRPFVIIASPKSGSTWFRKMLGSHAALEVPRPRVCFFLEERLELLLPRRAWRQPKDRAKSECLPPRYTASSC